MTGKSEYDKCLETMYRLRRFGIKLGLDTIGSILSALGNPQHRFRVIHIAGTNGKGSIASGLSSILAAAGYRVGLYTSPHLVRFNERICIDNDPVTDEMVVDAYTAVANVPQPDREPTFFEFSTAMAFYLFGRETVDWAIVETGMGGRLDATNMVDPVLSVISNISLEHREYLGESVEAIAFEKAGIIKPDRPVVTGVQQAEAVETITAVARRHSSPLFRFGRDFRIEAGDQGAFTYVGMDHVWAEMKTGLTGRFQLDNAAITLAACEVLRRNGTNIPEPAIREGLALNRWPGRLEVVSTSPMVLLDGAHNLAAAEHLAGFLSSELQDRKITLVIGILDDKPYPEILRFLLPVCRKAILTQARNERALPAETLLAEAAPLLPDVTAVPRVDAAIEQGLAGLSPDEILCIAGSLYVVGEAKAWFERQGLPAFQLNRPLKKQFSG